MSLSCKFRVFVIRAGLLAVMAALVPPGAFAQTWVPRPPGAPDAPTPMEVYRRSGVAVAIIAEDLDLRAELDDEIGRFIDMMIPRRPMHGRATADRAEYSIAVSLTLNLMGQTEDRYVLRTTDEKLVIYYARMRYALVELATKEAFSCVEWIKYRYILRSLSDPTAGGLSDPVFFAWTGAFEAMVRASYGRWPNTLVDPAIAALRAQILFQAAPTLDYALTFRRYNNFSETEDRRRTVMMSACTQRIRYINAVLALPVPTAAAILRAGHVVATDPVDLSDPAWLKPGAAWWGSDLPSPPPRRTPD